MSDVDLIVAARERLTRYGQHDIGNRHISDGRDGLKPVQRRVLWAMHQLGATSKDKHVKQARVMGDCTGRYHPHGEASVATAMVNMCQTRTRAPLVVGIGNWGSHVDGSAAPRYISCYLSAYAQQGFLDADELACVTMVKNYDGTTEEPLFLPSRLPNFLIQGCAGISYGVAVNVPPVDPKWVMDSVEALVAGKKLRNPDAFNYRYGGVLVDLDPEWLTTGSGRATFRPTVRAYQDQRKLVLTSLTPAMNVESKLESFRDLDFVAGVYGEDGTDPEGLFTIEFKRNSDFKSCAKQICDKLYSSVSFNFIYVTRSSEEEFVPHQTSPLDYLKGWVKWRMSFTTKVAKYRASRLQADIDRLDLLLRLIAKRDEVMKILKSAKTRERLALGIQKTLKCTAEQATYILGVPIVRLSTLDQKDLREKVADLEKQLREQKKIAKAPEEKMLFDARHAFDCVGREV